MKKIVLAILLTFNISVLCAQWVPQTSNITPGYFVQFIDAVNSNVCWGLVADPLSQSTAVQEFTRTIDGGTNWSGGGISNAAGLAPSSICAIGEDTAWVAMFNPSGGAGAILKTEDGGFTWTPQPTAAFTASGNFPNMVYFWDAQTGVCMGDPTGGYFEIYITSDGGTNWTRVPSLSIAPILAGEFGITDVFCANGSTLWFGTNLGRIYKSTDFGQNWSAASTPFTGDYIGSIAFRDADNGIASEGSVGGPADFIRTTDGGATWTLAGANTGSFTTVLSSCYVPGTDSTYFLSNPAAGSVNGTAYSPNDGNTWVVADALIHTDVDFVDDSTGWTGSNELDAPMFKWSTPIRVPLIEVASSSIDVGTNTGLVTQTPKATVMNNSLGVHTFDVTMSITGGYLSTKTVNALGFGNSTQVSFDPWTPAATGPFTITVYTSLAEDTDNNNDTLTKDVTVFEAFENYGWVSKTDLTVPVFGMASAFNLNGVYSTSPGTLYSFGGADGAAVSTVTNAFNDATGLWNTANPMPSPKYQFSAHTVRGKIYCIGGYSAGFAPDENNYVYDIAGGTWSTMTPMPIAVGDYASGVYHDSIIYYIGGYDGGSDQNIVQIYDTYNDAWTNGTPSIGTPASGLRGGMNGNQIIYAGGYSQTLAGPVDEAYQGIIDPANPSSITWTAIPPYPGGTVSRLGAGTVYKNLKPLIVFVGGDPTGAGTEALGDCWAWDLTLNQWLVGTEKTTPVRNISDLVGVVYNDSLYMASSGGYDGASLQTVNEWLNLGYMLIDGVKSVGSQNTLFTLYPNPASAHVTLQFETEHPDMNISILDVTGRIVHSEFTAKQQKSVRLSTQQLQAGAYLVQVIGTDGQVIGRSQFVIE